MFRLFEKSEEDGCYNLTSYQSTQVLDILLSNQVYRAYKSITFAKGYQALIDILGLDCVCPIFACVMGKPSCADGRVSSSVLLTLRVPKEKVRLTPRPQPAPPHQRSLARPCFGALGPSGILQRAPN